MFTLERLPFDQVVEFEVVPLIQSVGVPQRKRSAP